MVRERTTTSAMLQPKMLPEIVRKNLYIPSVSDPPRCCIFGDDALEDAIELFNLIVGKKPCPTTKQQLPPPTLVNADYIRQTFSSFTNYHDQDLLDSGFILQIDTYDSFSTRAASAPPPVPLGFEYKSICASRALCDFAIVVVNIELGLKTKTADLVRLLSSTLSPFVIALTRIDAISGWKFGRRYTMTESAMRSQSPVVSRKLGTLFYERIKELQEQCNICPSLIFDHKHSGQRVVPVGAISGEGVVHFLHQLFGYYYCIKSISTRHLREKVHPAVQCMHLKSADARKQFQAFGETSVRKSASSQPVKALGETSVRKSGSFQPVKESYIEAPGETIVRKSASSQPVKALGETSVGKSASSQRVKCREGIRGRDLAEGGLDLSMNDSSMECVRALVKLRALPFLPAKYLLQLKIVSKGWNQWIGGVFFAYRQSIDFHTVSGFFRQDCEDISFVTLNASLYGIPDPSLKFLPEQVVIRNSCKGLLLCQGKSGENVYYICNPTSKEFDVLPLPTYFHGDEPKVVLVFEPSVENFVAEYKVVCPIVVNEPTLYFEVYDSRARSWKCCPAGDGVTCDILAMKDGFFSGGLVYWETLPGGYVSFDIRTEKCHVHPQRRESMMDGSFLFQINGRLCYIQPRCQYEELCIDFIVGNDTVNVSYSLSIPKELLPGVSQECEVLPCVCADVLMIRCCGALYFYSIKHQGAELVRKAEYWQSGRYISYVNSLVPL